MKINNKYTLQKISSYALAGKNNKHKKTKLSNKTERKMLSK